MRTWFIWWLTHKQRLCVSLYAYFQTSYVATNYAIHRSVTGLQSNLILVHQRQSDPSQKISPTYYFHSIIRLTRRKRLTEKMKPKMTNSQCAILPFAAAKNGRPKPNYSSTDRL